MNATAMIFVVFFYFHFFFNPGHIQKYCYSYRSNIQSQHRILPISDIKDNKTNNLKGKGSRIEKGILVYSLLAFAVIIILILIQLADRQRLVIQLRKQHKIIEEKNQLLEIQKKEIMLQSQNLEDQKEEILVQSQQLSESNLEILTVNNSLENAMLELNKKNIQLQHFNDYLDTMVKARVAEIEIKNQQIAEYAFVNAHKLRSPLASIIGITSLMKFDEMLKNNELIEHLALATKKMDEVVHEIQTILNEESDHFNHLK